MRLLVTRPEPDASRSVAALVARGHAAIASPLMRTETLSGVSLPERAYQAVLATSANAVRALAAHPRRGDIAHLPLFCVGDRTAGEAARLGFRDVRSAKGAAGHLASLVASSCDPASGPVLYAAGERRTGDVDGRLLRAGFSVETVALYRMAEEPVLSPAAITALREGGLDGALLYSARSAVLFAEALRAARLVPLPSKVRLFCLSGAVAAPLSGLARTPPVVAAAPTEAHLFALLETVPSI